MALIKKEDFIESIADALQFISYYHSEDFISSMREAYEKEKSIPAKDAMLQILTSSKIPYSIDLYPGGQHCNLH